MRHLKLSGRGRAAVKGIRDWIAGDLSNRLVSRKLNFTLVYKLDVWTNSSPSIPKSGLGSTVENTVTVRKTLSETAKRLFGGQDTLRVVDAPCGDMTWMPLLIEDLATTFQRVEYTGIDIVSDIIKENKKMVSFSGNVSSKFLCKDIIKSKIPDCDLLVCKDLVNHLKNDDIFLLLNNIQNSNARYVIISSNKGWENAELPVNGMGTTRYVNLQASPFMLPQPVQDDGYLALWKLPWRPFNPATTR